MPEYRPATSPHSALWPHLTLLCLVTAGTLACSQQASRAPAPDSGAAADAAPPTPRKAKRIVAGAAHACALLEDDTVVCWGDNDAGQLGDGTHEARDRPVRFGVSAATELVAGFAATCARSGDEPFRCAGRLMLGTTGPETTPQPIAALRGVSHVGLGRLHGCAVASQGGEVACWGSNHFGQFGDDSAPGCGSELARRRTNPEPVPGVTGATRLITGDTGSCALLDGGGLKCWGSLGLPTRGDQSSRCRPLDVTGVANAKQVVVGAHHGCVLQGDGRVKCWGANAIGQLGSMTGGTTPAGHGAGGPRPRQPPTLVANLEDAVEIAAFGTAHTCARRRSGQVVCWGRNVDGQLGDGTTTSRFAPVAVPGINDAVGIATGYDFTCALRSTGQVLCWGKNADGQLGDGTRRNSDRPVLTRL